MPFWGFATPRARAGAGPERALPAPEADEAVASRSGRRDAVLAGGCFWCIEAVFEQIEGVESAVSGYAGGDAETAHYEAVCTGATGHAEAVRVRYDPAVVTFGALLRLFFTAHDPTQLNRQGPDVGPQYRSAVFYADEDQRRVAEHYIDQLERAEVFDRPIVTRLEPLEGFYPAEEKHQDFVAKHPEAPYVLGHAGPKIEAIRVAYPHLVSGAS